MFVLRMMMMIIVVERAESDLDELRDGSKPWSLADLRLVKGARGYQRRGKFLEGVAAPLLITGGVTAAVALNWWFGASGSSHALDGRLQVSAALGPAAGTITTVGQP